MSSAINGTPLSRSTPQPVYYTAAAARTITGVAPNTVRRNLPPDIWLASIKGDKFYPAWTRATLEAWATEWRKATGFGSGQSRSERAIRGYEQRKARLQGGA